MWNTEWTTIPILQMSGPQPVQSVVRSMRLLEALASVGELGRRDLGVTEISRLAGLSPGTAHRLLATLGGEGYVTRDETTSRYRLGPRLFALAAVAESEIATVRAQAAAAMEDLKHTFRETVNLAVLDRRHIIYVDQVESDRSVRAFNRTGNRVLAHASAAGKALLAFEPDQVLENLANGDRLEGLTPATMTSLRNLIAHLAEVRHRGYALDLGEQDDEVICVAAPIRSSDRRPVAALSISGPATRMRRLELKDLGVRIAAVAAGVLGGPGASADFHPGDRRFDSGWGY